MVETSALDSDSDSDVELDADSADAVGALDSGCVSTSLVVVEGGIPADGGVVEASELVASVCAPPLLLTVTPDPTSVLDDVAPDVVEVPVAAVAPVPAPADVDPVVDVEPPPFVVAVDEVPVVDAAEVDDAAELVDDSEDDAPVSADANPNPYPVETAATSQAATASPPYPLACAAARARGRVATPADEAVLWLLLNMACPFSSMGCDWVHVAIGTSRPLRGPSRPAGRSAIGSAAASKALANQHALRHS